MTSKERMDSWKALPDTRELHKPSWETWKRLLQYNKSNVQRAWEKWVTFNKKK